MVLCAYICVYAFSLRRKSSDMILEDKFLICLCAGHGGAGSYDDGLNLELAAAGPFDGPVHGQATSSACCDWVGLDCWPVAICTSRCSECLQNGTEGVVHYVLGIIHRESHMQDWIMASLYACTHFWNDKLWYNGFPTRVECHEK
jgi:hypothetical protein